MAVQDLERIEQKINRAEAGAIAVSDNVGGIMFTNMSEVIEFAKLMSVAKNAVPKHLQGEPGTCLAVCIQALEWRMSPFAVANKSYEVNGRVAYESQLIHAVVEARAPIKQRLRKTYTGAGPDLQCKVIGHFKGELDPVEYESPKLSEIKVKNSPLWVTDPKQQLWYYSVRAWARANCPDVLLGIYAEDELKTAEIGPQNARDVTPRPDVASRLGKDKGERGFNHDNVDRALEHKPGEALPPEPPKPDAVPAAAGTPAEQQMTLAADAGDVETEIKAKVAAINNADTAADVNAMLDAGKAYLQGRGRGDLLGEIMSAADKRLKKVKA